MAHSREARFKTEILTGDDKLDQQLQIGPDPHGTLTTGTGHSRSHVKPDSSEATQQIKLTKEEQDILDGKQGEVLAKVMKTVVAYGNAFGADKLVDLGGNPHSVLLFGSSPVQPIVDILNDCADAGLKTYAPYTMDPRPYDFDNVETEPEYQYKLQKLYSIQRDLEMVHLRLGAKNNNYWSCTCYYKEVGNAPPAGTNLCWSESSAVNFANSGLGCRSNRNPGGVDVLCNILGKAPHFGLMTDEGRKAKWLIDVRLDKEPQWSLLGGAIGMKVMEDVPYITGISQWLDNGVTDHSIGKLKDMGASTASNGAVGLYHVEDVTPEVKQQGRDLLADGYQTYVIDEAELERVQKNYPNTWAKKDAKPTRAFVGCPHNSFNQLYEWGLKISQALEQRSQDQLKVPLYLFCSNLVRDHFMDEHPELAMQMKRLGAIFSNTCPLMFAGVPGITEKEFFVTNSNKTRVYSNSRFFKDDAILEIVVSGEIPPGA
jgi:predicted aconitase